MSRLDLMVAVAITVILGLCSWPTIARASAEDPTTKCFPTNVCDANGVCQIVVVCP